MSAQPPHPDYRDETGEGRARWLRIAGILVAIVVLVIVVVVAMVGVGGHRPPGVH